jgi:hypothetical protein
MPLGTRVWKRPDRFRLTILIVSILLLAASFAALSRRAPDPAPARGLHDAADVAFPFDVRVVPLDPLHPGRALRARVEVTSRRLLDDVTVTVPAPGPVGPVENPGGHLGSMRAGDVRSTVVVLTLPPGRTRRTVDFRVTANIDGWPVVRGASLNVVYEREPSRIVIAPDGRRIHEVTARRIG